MAIAALVVACGVLSFMIELKQARIETLEAKIALVEDDAKRQQQAIINAENALNLQKTRSNAAQIAILREIKPNENALDGDYIDLLNRLCNAGAACEYTR
jgi:hypothetical protein